MTGFFTVVTKSYLSYAYVLMSRISTLHPDSKRRIFVIDIEFGKDLDSIEVADFVGANEFFTEGLDQFLHFKYNAFELSNAARPHAHRFFRDHTNCDQWIYLDADIFPVNSLEQLMDLEDQSQIFISPHRTKPSNDILKPQGESRLLQNGAYNSGFLALKRGDESNRFIEWFVHCCNIKCYDRHEYCFVDQLWLNLVPTLFESVHIVKNPGVNIGYWNIDERPLKYNSEGVLTVDNLPVMFLHFSGWNSDHPEIMSRYYSDKSVPKPWFDYANQYSVSLKKAEEQFPNDISYKWNTYNEGSPIQLVERRIFAQLQENDQWQKHVNPFSAHNILREQKPGKTERIANRIGKIPQKIMNFFK